MGILDASVGTQPRTRGLAVGLVAVAVTVVAAAGIALAPRPSQLGPTNNTVTQANPRYGQGYPLHDGLAGPGRSAAVEVWGYGPGYPQHGGLAGPSRAGSDR